MSTDKWNDFQADIGTLGSKITCKVGQFLSEAPASVQELVESALSRSGVNRSDVYRVLTKYGAQFGITTFKCHARQECVCYGKGSSWN